jgi:hypothetical protein
MLVGVSSARWLRHECPYICDASNGASAPEHVVAMFRTWLETSTLLNASSFSARVAILAKKYHPVYAWEATLCQLSCLALHESQPLVEAFHLLHFLPVHRLLVHRLPVHRLPVHRLPVHRLPVHRRPLHSLQAHCSLAQIYHLCQAKQHLPRTNHLVRHNRAASMFQSLFTATRGHITPIHLPLPRLIDQKTARVSTRSSVLF